jgi:hypothetical protein
MDVNIQLHTPWYPMNKNQSEYSDEEKNLPLPRIEPVVPHFTNWGVTRIWKLVQGETWSCKTGFKNKNKQEGEKCWERQ